MTVLGDVKNPVQDFLGDKNQNILGTSEVFIIFFFSKITYCDEWI
mgnify:CR=1 FL=1